MNPRLFSYLKNSYYEFDIDQTFPSLKDYWCEHCEKCEDVAAFITEKKCGGDLHKRWNCPLHPSFITTLEPGTHGMGNLETLRWAIVKGHSLTGNDLVSNKLYK